MGGRGAGRGAGRKHICRRVRLSAAAPRSLLRRFRYGSSQSCTRASQSWSRAPGPTSGRAWIRFSPSKRSSRRSLVRGRSKGSAPRCCSGWQSTMVVRVAMGTGVVHLGMSRQRCAGTLRVFRLTANRRHGSLRYRRTLRPEHVIFHNGVASSTRIALSSTCKNAMDATRLIGSPDGWRHPIATAWNNKKGSNSRGTI